jgi:YidC/Oxa1 family membrane protein insertase
MKRKDIIILGLLIGLILALPFLDKAVFRKIWPAHPAPAAVVTNAPDASAKSAAVEPAIGAADPTDPTDRTDPTAPTDPSDDSEADSEPEQTFVLSNGLVSVTLSSRGGSVRDATLREYRSALAADSSPVVLDFSDRRALAYEALPGLGENNSFSGAVGADGKSVRFERKAASGLALVRTYTLGAAYQLDVQDELVNRGRESIPVSPYAMVLGTMTNQEPHHGKSMWVTIGVDTLSPGGEGVKHWGSDISKWFSTESKEKALPKLPVTINRPPPRPVPATWVAVKNKYFVQILTPEDGGDAFSIWARRQLDPQEVVNPAFAPKMQPIDAVSATITFPEQVLAEGESFARNSEYYIGPKKLSELQATRLHHVKVMEFGMWAPIGEVLLRVLNFLDRYLHNYGVAIMLLTLIIKILFWPITHKSTQSMKKMTALQPKVKELQAKHKENPQKMQQEMMALYRENKVNPLSGCLPLLIQIPVFIALFVVLRSAIELRFAPFLWIKDLSEPENLFANVLPFSLNVLPLLMAGTMFLQMKLTPATGDPAQQKIMMFMMPGMMLFFLYTYPAGLALYWTTQNLLMIIQQLMNQRDVKLHPQEAAAKR